jgi:hypothetical protein
MKIFKFPALFLSIESENVWPSAMATFAVLHVEKDDHVMIMWSFY